MVGAASLWFTPKKEDPQIVVPMADVLIQAPGLSAQQIEKQVTEPLEKRVSQIDGVEFFYSSSKTLRSIAIKGKTELRKLLYRKGFMVNNLNSG